MYAVIFEVQIKEGCQDTYLALGAKMREKVGSYEGVISAERFTSVVTEGKICSLSYWESEEAIARWKQDMEHQMCQREGQMSLFEDYRIRIAKVERDYSMPKPH
ncbi:antibiotic biosynthesis monooxygenase family protein [Parendozoicomonas haliclonae]|uniref:Antibiotic biosynthesis monooxygenase n=1 Tax=Parendozoicomonas haliclonae TaxID=1960125 RepID=A0A1X7ARS5_9GAMM|nr:antibiotic biosynthesis monooxygenase [Parendozoicomonas haliclonae]SMA50790.1 Antibiotic biosynthesis monooxygenase [Parendozoicomonas haliclonae]